MRRIASPSLLLALLLAGCDDDHTTSGSGSTGASTGTGQSGTTLSLPQFVHGAAYADARLSASIPVVIAVTGAQPDSVDVTVDGAAVGTEQDADRFVATVDLSALADGPHAVVATAKVGGAPSGTVQGSLVRGDGSLQFTDFTKDGPAYSGHLAIDPSGEEIRHTWISIVGGQHQLSLSHLDGAFQQIEDTNVVPLNAPGDEPLNGYTAFSPLGLGVVYRTAKAGDSHWSVKLRVLDGWGTEKVPVQDLTGSGASFSMQAAGADANGFSAAWLHITPPASPADPAPPVEVRFARWDMTNNALQGPITLDTDQPDKGDGPQRLEPLGEIQIACNSTVCLVTYTRDKFNTLVQLNVPKLHVAVVDIATGKQIGTAEGVADNNWDTQLFGHHLVAMPDESFRLVYTANDTAAAVTPKSPCDETLERDLLFAVTLDKTGKVLSRHPIFDFEGTRQYPRIAPHPAGFAMLWEDQRSECTAGGHIRMTANVGNSSLDALLDPYVELPDSVGLPPEDPTLSVAGTNVLVGWSDNRHGMGLLDPKNEIFLDTYWRR